MKQRVIVIGAGMGGLCSALRLRQLGVEVLLLEARGSAGGLASGVTFEDFEFDAGPYILLDRPGLQWISQQLQWDFLPQLHLMELDVVYETTFSTGEVLRIYRDLEKTADGFESLWPGSAQHYRSLVNVLQQRHEALRPWLYREHPGAWDVLTSGLWKQAPFVLRPLASVLAASGLPVRVREALSIWTHVAGQNTTYAPAPLALVCALIHSEGAYYPRYGIRSIPKLLESKAVEAGVDIRFNTPVQQILLRNGKVESVLTEAGETLPCSTVISKAHGLSTYSELTSRTPASSKRRLGRLPLQSPGICIYLAVRRSASMPYLRFQLPGKSQLCRLFISPGNLLQTEHSGWEPARLLAPMIHAEAEQMGFEGHQEFASRILEESWWREGISEHRVLSVRTPQLWGREFRLYRNSMNPVMTSKSLRQGRLSHKSPWVEGLYLCGSSTDPGQWVSFCGISGILAADAAKRDLS